MKRNLSALVSKTSVCSNLPHCDRCADLMDYPVASFMKRLTDHELTFIRSRWPQNVCSQCVRQLRNTYRISVDFYSTGGKSVQSC